jgi:hypothetical protein
VGKRRFQDSGVRNQNEEHLLSADYVLLSADAYCRLPTAFEGGGMERAFARMTTLDKMSPPTGKEETSNFKK